ncbi:sulfite exporter TauE/SafE family protein [Marivita hallyeonensis]|nr:sulfite exporter TauE/SafE family protein [Marivita hallyeonensis]
MEAVWSLHALGVAAVLAAMAGALSGILAGLFGIGGGAVLVPVLYELFGFMGVDPSVRTHMSIGTSFAIILPTALTSFRAHAAKGAPDLRLLRQWVLLVPLGVLSAGFIVSNASGEMLRLVFAVIALAIAAKMLLGSDAVRLADDLPGQPWRGVIGFLIGFLSALIGIGGGNINNVFMTLFGRSLHQAIATSAGLGLLIGLPGLAIYVVTGLGVAGRPIASLGYLNLLGFMFIMPIAVWLAPVGARIAHGLSDRRMKQLFGLFLVLVAVRFLGVL